MAKYILKRKLYTKWDETDTLKGMRDSDILSQTKKKVNTTEAATSVAGSALKGAAIGGGLGLAGGALYGANIGKGAGMAKTMKAMGKSSAKLGKAGLIAGAAIGSVKALGKINKEANDNAFYNRRLGYAQRQAKRRERKDWKTNMTQREGYSY